MKRYILIAVFCSYAISVFSQNKDHLERYLFQANIAAIGKDQLDFVYNIHQYSTYLIDEDIKPENLSKNHLNTYCNALYYGIINKMELSTLVGRISKPFVAYEIEDKAENMFTMGYLIHNGFISSRSIESTQSFDISLIPPNLRDYKSAFDWYEKSAALKNTMAMVQIASMYLNGEGVRQSYSQARKWYKKSAKKGNVEAMLELGRMYALGTGVKVNNSKAMRWFEKGAKAGNKDAREYFKIYNAKKNIKPSKIPVNKILESNDDYVVMSGLSLYEIGMKFYNDENMLRKYESAIEWFLKSAKKEYDPAMFQLGIMYETGQGVKINLATAFQWFLMAANQGNEDAMYKVAVKYDVGEGVVQSYLKAKNWYEKSALKGNPKSMYNLGLLYTMGQGTEVNYSKARQWFEKSAAHGDPEAMYNLGLMYQNGMGVEKDDSQALKLFAQAREMGLDNILLSSDIDESDRTSTEKDINSEDKPYKQIIRDFVDAEDQRDFESIADYFSTNLMRYWDLKFPSKTELRTYYNNAWKNSDSSSNEIIRIQRVSSSIYDMNTNFKFTNKQGQKKEIKSTVRFIFDNEKKIVECFGL